MSTAFSFFMLQSYISPAMSQAEATAFVPILIVAGLLGTLIALIVAAFAVLPVKSVR